jgi:hypothetical protein
MAVYYIKDYIAFTQRELEKAKKDWRNGKDWDEEEYQRIEFLEKTLKSLTQMLEHGEIFYTDF